VTLGALFPFVVAIHVALAVSLFLPSILLPFGLRLRGGRWQEGPRRLSRALFWLQRSGSLVIGAGLVLTGGLLLLSLGVDQRTQHWLILALAIYGLNLALALVIQRPGLARLMRLQPGDSEEARRRWRDWARRQRYLSYVMAGLIGVIAFLMSAKPDL
jgi:hypothetical protein